jgi:alpha-tubulin suppressor-like RCC1 family protein
MAAGGVHSLFVKSDLSMWMMGATSYDTRICLKTPTPITSNVVSVAAGRWGHSVFIKEDGSLWSMGENDHGQLGDGTTVDRSEPVKVADAVVAANAGVRHSMFICKDGSLWGMGDNYYRLLGDGNTNRTSPVWVGMAASMARGWSEGCAVIGWVPIALPESSVLLGEPITLAPTFISSEDLFAFQWAQNGTNLPDATNFSYTIGSATRADEGDYELILTSRFGRTVAKGYLAVRTIRISDQPQGAVLAEGSPYNLRVTSEGFGPLAYQWFKDGGALPNQTNNAISFSSFRLLDSGSYYVVITNRYEMTISIPINLCVSNAPLRRWGATTPIVITNNVAAAASGYAHTLFVKADSTLWSFGINDYGQLGDATRKARLSPLQVGSNVVVVAAGVKQSLFIKADGTLWGMGDDSTGSLGTGFSGNYLLPTLIAGDMAAASASQSFSLVLKCDGTLWGMGVRSGILTNATGTSVLISSNVTAMSAGSGHSVVLKADGTLWGMGSNLEGQLGIGSFSPSSPLVLIANGVLAVKAGSKHTLFLRADGSLWGMGANSAGQLGIGTNANQNLPVLITNGVVAFSAGTSHSLYATGDGRLFGMGTGCNLGTGTAPDSTRPFSISDGGFRVATLPEGPLASPAIAIGGGPYVTLTNKLINPGESATFSPSTPGETGPLSFQWLRNGTNILNATNCVYSISQAGYADAGDYTVFVESQFGYTRASATLVVNSAPVAIPLVMGAFSGEPQTLNVVNRRLPALDVDGDPVTIVSTTQGLNGGSVTNSESHVTYTSSAGFVGVDHFDYALGDSRGFFSTNTISVSVVSRTPEHNQLRIRLPANGKGIEWSYLGIPNSDYVVECTPNLLAPINWDPLATNFGDSSGIWNFTNQGSIGSPQFLRTRLLP